MKYSTGDTGGKREKEKTQFINSNIWITERKEKEEIIKPKNLRNYPELWEMFADEKGPFHNIIYENRNTPKV